MFLTWIKLNYILIETNNNNKWKKSVRNSLFNDVMACKVIYICLWSFFFAVIQVKIWFGVGDCFYRYRTWTIWKLVFYDKIFQGGGETYYLPKMHLKRYYFPPKKLKNILIGPARGLGGARAPSCPPLRTPMHVVQCFQVYLFQ